MNSINNKVTTTIIQHNNKNLGVVVLLKLLLNFNYRNVSSKKSTSGGFPLETDGDSSLLHKLRVAREEEYFRRKDKEQFEVIKLTKIDEINFHKQQIRKSEDAIERHVKRLEELGEHCNNLKKIK